MLPDTWGVLRRDPAIHQQSDQVLYNSLGLPITYDSSWETFDNFSSLILPEKGLNWTMRSSSTARRKARVVGQDDEDIAGSSITLARSTEEHVEPSPTIVRPGPSRSSSKKRSSLRVSFGPGGGTSMLDADGGQEGKSEVFTPVKSSLSRQAISNNAGRRKAGLASELSRPTSDRPSYTAESLDELKSATPSAPRDRGVTGLPDTEETKALDLAAKFGNDLALRTSDGAVPSATEIAEKKARRARLAKEQAYISLHAENSDDEDNEITLRPREKYPETRLIPDDEDVAEGFDDFVEDGRVALGRKAEREQRHRERDAMKALIAEAEGDSESGSEEDSEAERLAAYESAQTRAGMDGLRRDAQESQQRPRTPPRITPLPSLAGVLDKMRERLERLKAQKEVRAKRMEEVRIEKQGIEQRAQDIQKLLKEAGEAYEKLRADAGIPPANVGANGQALLGDGERGLESLGTPEVEVGSP